MGACPGTGTPRVPREGTLGHTQQLQALVQQVLGLPEQGTQQQQQQGGDNLAVQWQVAQQAPRLGGRWLPRVRRSKAMRSTGRRKTAPRGEGTTRGG